MMSENGKSTVYLFLSGLLLVAALAGCKEKAEPEPTEPAEQEEMSAPEQTSVPVSPPAEILPVDTASSSRLAEAMSLWNQGQQDEAIEVFVNIQWKGSVGFAESSPLALTEEQFKQLPASERDERLAELVGEVVVLRSLTKAVLEKGQAAADGKRYANAALTFGKLLAEDKEALVILQMLGEALQKKAAEQSP